MGAHVPNSSTGIVYHCVYMRANTVTLYRVHQLFSITSILEYDEISTHRKINVP
jgi:hypothetical protein